MSLQNYVKILNEIIPKSVTTSTIAKQFRNSKELAQFLKIVYRQNFVASEAESESSKAKVDELTSLFKQIPNVDEREFAIEISRGVVNYDPEALLDLLDLICSVYTESLKQPKEIQQTKSVEMIEMENKIKELECDLKNKNELILKQQGELSQLKLELQHYKTIKGK
ncbi:Conserved_hypothetical protein [Hexamita inflata]|uniref:Uncharacterized protein n=1 Tax=Hexamita inflata TaxID=28002 RepID=A0AA86QPE1_9EUKA|nr:Conserved hypothetical protein [Hexamita inflata]